jgi:APA family basic amino acid/polyamine antiporter
MTSDPISIFARKPIEDLQPPGEDAHSLKRVLGAGDLVMLAIGAVIGAGIFGAIGTAAAGQIGPNGEVIRYGAGPALIFSFVLLGAACALAALCYAELAAMIPQAGSAYAYSYATPTRTCARCSTRPRTWPACRSSSTCRRSES